jgi:hypothetical protein
MFYLFKRMGRINKAEWKGYLFGCLFSIGDFSDFSNNPDYSQPVCSGWMRLPSFRYYLGLVHYKQRSRKGVELINSCLSQPRVSRASRMNPLMNAAIPVTATLSGE